MSKPIYIYLAGPLTTGDTLRNIRRAFHVGSELFDLGYTVFIPHLSAFWDIIHPTKEVDYERWMEYDFNWLAKCDMLVRLPGDSSGADREWVFAKKNKIPAYTLDQFWKKFHPTAKHKTNRSSKSYATRAISSKAKGLQLIH